jgi:hypothetical protein
MPSLGRRANRLTPAAKVDNVEAGDHFNAQRKSRRRERVLDADCSLNPPAFPIEEPDFDGEARGAAGDTSDMSEREDGAAAQCLEPKRELVRHAATEGSGVGLDGRYQRY